MKTPEESERYPEIKLLEQVIIDVYEKISNAIERREKSISISWIGEEYNINISYFELKFTHELLGGTEYTTTSVQLNACDLEIPEELDLLLNWIQEKAYSVNGSSFLGTTTYYDKASSKYKTEKRSNFPDEKYHILALGIVDQAMRRGEGCIEKEEYERIEQVIREIKQKDDESNPIVRYLRKIQSRLKTEETFAIIESIWASIKVKHMHVDITKIGEKVTLWENREEVVKDMNRTLKKGGTQTKLKISIGINTGIVVQVSNINNRGCLDEKILLIEGQWFAKNVPPITLNSLNDGTKRVYGGHAAVKATIIFLPEFINEYKEYALIEIPFYNVSYELNLDKSSLDGIENQKMKKMLQTLEERQKERYGNPTDRTFLVAFPVELLRQSQS
ncbi:MAG: hypothetical protein Kow0081_0350 [Candidatus Dojkabacteria bacterium]